MSIETFGRKNRHIFYITIVSTIICEKSVFPAIRRFLAKSNAARRGSFGVEWVGTNVPDHLDLTLADPYILTSKGD